MEDLLEADHLRRSFGAVEAVRDASLRLAPGTVTALVGPNGSGKTTLMLMLAGLLAPDAGRISVCGTDHATHGARARSLVGWMPDTFGTWDTLSCTEILTTFAAAYRIPPAVARTQAAALLDRVNLAELAAAPARTLSRGQKQRLGLARALVHSPRVLLLDEPASGMDPASRVDLRELVRALAAQGRAVLVSSHILSELEELVDDAVLLEGGITSPPRSMRAGDTDDAEAGLPVTWRLRVLDAGAFRAWADGVGLPYTPETVTSASSGSSGSSGGAAGVSGAAGGADGAAGAVGAGLSGQPASFLLTLTGEAQAAMVVRDAVVAGVLVSQIAPRLGRLERAYLGMGAQRA